MTAAVSVRLLERVREVPREEWDALQGVERSPFVEHTWLDCLEEAGCVGEERGWLPRHIAVYRGAKLIAVCPAYAKASSEGEFVFDWSWAELAHRLGIPYYPKLVIAVPFTPVTGPRVLVAPGEDRREITRLVAFAAIKLAGALGAEGVHVLFPEAEEAAVWEEAGFFRRAGFQYHFFREGAETFEAYVERYPSKRRNQIRRECQRATKDGIRIETLSRADLSRDVVRAMHGFYASTVDRHYYGQRYLNLRFFELVSERFPERLAWVLARDAAGAPIAGAFNVTKGNRLYGRYWGASVEQPFLHFDVCYYHGIKECIARGLDVFEPGAGGEHKRARGFVPTMTHSAHWIASKRMTSILLPHVQREKERVEAIVAGAEDDG